MTRCTSIPQPIGTVLRRDPGPFARGRHARGSTASRRAARGSVLIIVMWVAFGLVGLALYFAHTMALELRAAENRTAAAAADEAIAGAARYVKYLLANAEDPGAMPDPLTYRAEAVLVGDATFWLIGRGDERDLTGRPIYGLVDEASKLNLNTATLEMLQALPNMTPEVAAAILDWRDSDSDASANGAEDETYQRLLHPYRCKNGPFESVDELRLVYGATLALLHGEDANHNGLLDPNENDGDDCAPADNRDGRLDPGFLEYCTVYSMEPATRSDGTARVSLAGNDQLGLASLLEERFGVDRANQILLAIGATTGGATTGGGAPGGGAPGGGAPGGGATGGQPGGTGGALVSFSSVLEFYLRSRMTADEFAQVEEDLTVSTNGATAGLINVNTAPEAVLACLPGIGPDLAPTLVAYRYGNADRLNSMAWVTEVLPENAVVQAGPFLTGRTHQISADIAAVGPHGRGYRRERFVFDTTDGTPRIVYRQDLTSLGWALGRDVREDIRLARIQR